VAWEARDRLGHDIKMLGGVQGNGRARTGPEVPRPHSSAIDHDVGRNLAMRRADADGPASVKDDFRHPRVLKNPRAAVPSRLSKRPSGVDGVRLTVPRQVHGAHEVCDLEERP
jgi:hypothetical protein